MQSKEHPRASAAALRDFRHTTRRLYKYWNIPWENVEQYIRAGSMTMANGL
jgi:hypothetical protein